MNAGASDEATREKIRRTLAARLAPEPDAPIALTARAWAVQGTAP